MSDALKLFVREDEGADLIEYALLAGLLAMACFVALSGVGTNLTSFFSSIATKVSAIAP